jgi:hypothetical protein
MISGKQVNIIAWIMWKSSTPHNDETSGTQILLSFAYLCGQFENTLQKSLPYKYSQTNHGDDINTIKCHSQMVSTVHVWDIWKLAILKIFMVSLSPSRQILE